MFNKLRIFVTNVQKCFLKFERYQNVAYMLHELGLPSIAVCVDRSRWSWVACSNSIIIVLFVDDVCAH